MSVRSDRIADGHPFMLVAILMAVTRDFVGFEPVVIGTVAIIGTLFYVLAALRDGEELVRSITGGTEA